MEIIHSNDWNFFLFGILNRVLVQDVHNLPYVLIFMEQAKSTIAPLGLYSENA
jgi:hypothetical protein